MHEQLSSFNLQVIHYTDYIQGNEDWRFSGIYADEGVSGTTVKNRTNFIKMIKDCEDGKIDLILTKSISRFARNTVDCIHYIRLLKNLPSPVGVYFEKENINTLDMNSEFLLTILSSLGQEESNSISLNTRWGIRKQFQQGIVSCSPPYGYRTDKNGEWIINEKEGDVIRRIYREYLLGKEIKKIAMGLMEDGIKTKKGNQVWSHASINLILINEKYCGDVLMQKTFKQDYLTHKTVANKGQLPQYFLEDHHPAIVNKQDWNACQEKRKSKRNGKAEPILPLKPREKYLFSNLLYCQNCGSVLKREVIRSSKKGQKYSYSVWRCHIAAGRVINSECHASSCKEENIEKAFMSMLYEMKKEQDILINEVRCEIENNRLDESEIEGMSILQNKILSLYDQFTDAAASIKADLDNALSGKRLYEISEQIETLNTEWSKLNKKQEIEQNISKDLKWLISELNKLRAPGEISGTNIFREDIFKRLVKRCIVYVDNRIIFEMNIGISREV